MGGSTSTGLARAESVMVNGLPGKMATEVARAIIKSPDFILHHFALTGAKNGKSECYIEGEKVHLYNPSQIFFFAVDSSSGGTPDIVIDYTLPDAGNDNASYYCEGRWPFVMGTTGVNRSVLEDKVAGSSVCAVIAPNMALPIVALQSFMESFAKSSPDSLKGYKLEIIESHQQGKADTSGTAKAMVKYFNQLGIEFSVEQIKMIRDPDVQLSRGVPVEFLGGHGWHNYMLAPLVPGLSSGICGLRLGLDDFFTSSPAFIDYEIVSERDILTLIERTSINGTVFFRYVGDSKGNVSLTHNVNGRDVYVDGTLEALRFLKKKINSGEEGRIYSMIDVLHGKD